MVTALSLGMQITLRVMTYYRANCSSLAFNRDNRFKTVDRSTTLFDFSGKWVGVLAVYLNSFTKSSPGC